MNIFLQRYTFNYPIRVVHLSSRVFILHERF